MFAVSCTNDDPDLENVPVPTDLTVSDISSTTAKLSWQGTADAYEITLGNQIVDTVETTTYNLTNLVQNTEYTWKVRAQKDGRFSEYAVGNTFKTIETIVVDFEDVTLTDGIWNGSDNSGAFVSGIASFKNSFTDWGGGSTSWSGFACSAKTDVTTPGFENQYSVYTGTGADNSKQFAVAYSDSATFTLSAKKILSTSVTNSTYAFLSVKNGDSYAKKFEAGDWFKVTFTAYNNDVKGNTVDYYLADFRDGKTFISDKWEKVDLSSLGTVDKVVLTFSSTDNGDWGMNTPAYVCLDNIEFEK